MGVLAGRKPSDSPLVGISTEPSMMKVPPEPSTRNRSPEAAAVITLTSKLLYIIESREFSLPSVSTVIVTVVAVTVSAVMLKISLPAGKVTECGAAGLNSKPAGKVRITVSV